MVKNIQAYFLSENDAESARASLQKLEVSNLLVDELPDAERKIKYVPILPMGAGSTGIDVTGAAGLRADSLRNDDDNRVTHLLEGQVEDEDYQEAQQILANNNGYGSYS